jgi:hypothetical protein
MKPGPYLTTIAGKSAVVFAYPVREGSMVEFYDAVTGVHRGCAGINWFDESGHVVPYNGPFPKIPDKERWS